MKIVVLLSGGMDSAVCLAKASEVTDETYAITLDYGQRNSFEIDAAKKIAKFFNVKEHKIVKLDLRAIGGSALTDDIDVPEAESGEGVPVTYVPGRNLIFLSVAMSWAEVLNADQIFIGANIIDYSGYPDCRPEFLKSFQKTADLGTKDETKIKISAPLLDMSKEDIVSEGMRLGVDFNSTSSCYDPDDEGNPCGKCESCILREKGFLNIEKD